MNFIKQIEASKPFYSGGFLYNAAEQKILLHKRDYKTTINPGMWGYFGGLSENQETPPECFKRELKEELNIDVLEKDIIALRDYLNVERGTWRYVFYVLSNLPKNEMKLGEGADFDWIPLDKVFDYDLTSKTILDLKFFINKLTH